MTVDVLHKLLMSIENLQEYWRFIFFYLPICFAFAPAEPAPTLHIMVAYQQTSPYSQDRFM